MEASVPLLAHACQGQRPASVTQEQQAAPLLCQCCLLSALARHSSVSQVPPRQHWHQAKRRPVIPLLRWARHLEALVSRVAYLSQERDHASVASLGPRVGLSQQWQQAQAVQAASLQCQALPQQPQALPRQHQAWAQLLAFRLLRHQQHQTLPQWPLPRLGAARRGRGSHSSSSSRPQGVMLLLLLLLLLRAASKPHGRSSSRDRSSRSRPQDPLRLLLLLEPGSSHRGCSRSCSSKQVP